MKDRYFDEFGNRVRLDTRYLGGKSPLTEEKKKAEKARKTKATLKQLLCIPVGVYVVMTLPLFRVHPTESMLELGTVLALTFIISTIAETWRRRNE